jgi:hypothetical protein
MSRTFALAVSWLICGCAVNEDEPVASVDQTLISPNGRTLTGISPDLISPNGVSLNGIDPIGFSANGAPISITISGPPLSGPDLVDSIWTGKLSDGTTAQLRVDEALQGSGANRDVWSYRFAISIGDEWRSLCADTSDYHQFADSVGGTWNPAIGVPGGGAYDASAPQFSLACRGSSIAKCVEFGYKPWTGHADELAACVRALRADYCGNGSSYTVDGTLVNIFDDAGIQPDSAAWVPEAEWTPNGAVCISNPTDTRFSQDARVRPSCYPQTLKPKNSCGSGFAGAVVVITELAPR